MFLPIFCAGVLWVLRVLWVLEAGRRWYSGGLNPRIPHLGAAKDRRLIDRAAQASLSL